MSLYRDAIATAGTGQSGNRPKVTMVAIDTHIPTPHGPVIAGELVEGEYFGPGESVHDVGWGLPKFIKKIGKGVKAVGKGVGKGVKKVGKGTVKVTKATGKRVAKGTVKSLKWVKKNPIKALALATLPLSAVTYAAVKVTKGAAKLAAKPFSKKRGGQQSEEAPAEEEQQALPPVEQEEAPGEPESYPGESESPTEENTPDVLEAPEAEEEPSEEEEPSADEGEEETSDSDNDSVQGDSDMSEGYYVGMEEIGADEEIAGEGEWVGAEEIGAVAKRPAQRKPGPNAVLVKQVKPSKSRRQFLPVSAGTATAAGASTTITIAPQTLFRGRRLVVPSSIAPSFRIDDIKVGNQSQGAAAGAIPAEAFLPTATGEDNIQMDSCSPGKTITLTVTNTSGTSATFSAVIFGDSVY